MSLYNTTAEEDIRFLRYSLHSLLNYLLFGIASSSSWKSFTLVSDERARPILLMFHSFLIPGVSLFAIAGNVTSIVILTRKGLKKCSSILLLSLAVSDVLFLIGVNNVPKYIYWETRFRFSKVNNYLLFIMKVMLDTFYTIGSSMASFIPVLITGERLLAIFYPFKVYLILTPRRTIIALSCLCQIPLARSLYADKLCNRLINYELVGNTIVSLVYPSDIQNIEDDSSGYVFELLTLMHSYITGIIPVSLITVGCVVIGLKIVQTSNRRQQLTSGRVAKRDTTKTTKTLLMICLLFVVSNGSVFAASCIIKAEMLLYQGPVDMVVYDIRNLVLCLNCLADSLIYFSANKRYWKTSIMGCRLKSSGRK